GHFTDPNGDRFVWEFSLHEKYQLFTFGAQDDDGRYDDELIHAIRGSGRFMSQRYARMLVEKIKPRSDFKFMSRDGRLVFRDGSSFRVNDDGTR
ncbi:hypothetical protein, partial [Campylobacter jejuni]|uniref:hypothetical protein n=1 Tax=Campylobacter jejuni TaxID=197 RepID=UPI001F08F8BA